MKKIFYTFSMFLMVSSAFAQTIILNESFSGNLPSGWTNTANSGTYSTWRFDNPGNRNMGGNFNSNFMILDSDILGSGNSQNTTVTTNSFDASSFNSVELAFDWQYRAYTWGESCKVEVFNGNNWVSVFLKGYNNGANYPSTTHEVIDITSIVANTTNAKVRFTYVGTWGYWWAIDNIQVSGTSSSGGGGGGSASSKSPGGVNDNSFVLWLDANELALNHNNQVTQWDDLSSHNNDAYAIQSDAPKYKTGRMNGYPVVDFTSNNNDYLKVANDNSLNPNEISIFIVSKFTNSSNAWASFVSKTSNNYFSNGYGILRNYYYSSSFCFINNYNYYRVSTTLPSGADNITTFSYNRNQIKILNNGGSQATYNYSTSINNSNNDLYIGAAPSNNGVGASSYLDGEIAEIIIFPKELTEINKILIHNYLSAKYSIQLQSQDYYNQDNSGSGNYDHNVTGIGKANDGSQVTSAKGTGIVTISSEGNLNNNTYLFWGENQKNSDYSFSTASDYMDRLNSVWRVSTYNNPGSVTISVDSSKLDLSKMQPCAELKLVVANASNFQSKTEYNLTYSNGQYLASNVTLQNGDHFSFEYQDVIGLDQNGFIGGKGQNNAPGPGDECFKLLVASNANYNYNILTDTEVREIEVQANGRFRIEANKALTVNGDIVNNGTIIIKENGSLIQRSTGPNNNSGTGTYELTRKGNNDPYIYNIWSSPITQTGFTTVFSSSNPCDIFMFEKETQSWKADYPVGYSATCNGTPVTFPSNGVISGGDGIMNVGIGYFIPGASAATRTFNGEVNNGDYSIPIEATNLGNPGGTAWADDDWNLIGNPYPSAISAQTFWQENAVDNNRITDALYFWDAADPNGGYNSVSDYAYWNSSGGVESGNSSKEPSGSISSGQGFWVVANTSSSVQFTNDMRVSSNSQFFKQEQKEQRNAWFNFTTPSNYENNILIGFNNAATDGIDHGFDAHKLVGNSHLRLASIIEGDEFVIQSLAPMNVNEIKAIPIVAFTDETGLHSFSNYKRKNLPSGVEVYLVDLELGIKQNLSDSNYQVHLTANITYTDRFQIEFHNNLTIANGGNGSKDQGDAPLNDSTDISTGITDQNNHNDFKFIQTESDIQLLHPEGFSGTIQILDITGKLVWQKTNLKNSVNEKMSIQNHPSGTYFLRMLNSNSQLFSTKFIIP